MPRTAEILDTPRTVLTIFGTRPELIKLAPVIAELERRPDAFQTRNVSSGQHPDLLDPLIELFNVRVDENLKSMRAGQPLNRLFANILDGFDPILDRIRPDAVIVQGDTTTAVAGALAAFHRKIPVGHVEAGLRTNDPMSPFPEEMNRRLITKLAHWHFAATINAVKTLTTEGIGEDRIFHVGNPVVDALHSLTQTEFSERLQAVLARTEGFKRVTMTAHRRENFAGRLEDYFRTVRAFADRHADVAVIFPMHPNPIVREAAYSTLCEHPRIHLTEPFDYPDFIRLLSQTWLIASDSGGVQEEAPSLGKHLLVLRESTERPEALETGFVQLAPTPADFARLLDEAYKNIPVISRSEMSTLKNPFGDGHASERIADIMMKELHVRSESGVTR